MTARSWVALVAILGLGAFLRFWGLGWGLRHPPDIDEQFFVEPARTMVARESFDPGWYWYPGLVFLVLKAVLAAAPDGASAYLVARGVVAAFSVASVGLAFLLGRRLLGEPGGFAAALLLAASPVEVQTAHMVRPDVVLGTLVLLALLAFTGLGQRLRQDVASGLGLGAVLATKFTGAALGPAWIVARWRAPGPRAHGLVVGGLCAAAVLVVTTPVLVSDPGKLIEGMLAQRDHMFDPAQEAASTPATYYAARYLRSLGPLGALAGALGVVATLRFSGGLLPALVFVAGMFAVLSSATSYRYERLIVSTLGVASLLAVRGLLALTKGRARLMLPAACIAALPPGLESVDYALAMRLPLARDLALDYLERTLPPGAPILSGVPGLGLDRFAYDVARPSGDEALDRIAAARADAVVLFESDPQPVSRGLETVFRARPATNWNGAPIVVQRSPSERRAAFAALAAEGLQLRTRPSSRGGLESVTVELASPLEIACVELRFAGRGGSPTRRLSLQLRSHADLAPATAIIGVGCGASRPGERRRALIFVPRTVRGLRVDFERDNRLELAGLRLYRLEPAVRWVG